MATTSGLCANCGAPASSVCAGCRYGLDVNGDLVASTLYCDQPCQKEHRNIHKGSCKANSVRMQLYRAGVFLQKVFD